MTDSIKDNTCPCGGQLRIVCESTHHFDMQGHQVDCTYKPWIACYECDDWDPIDGHPSVSKESQAAAISRSEVKTLMAYGYAELRFVYETLRDSGEWVHAAREAIGRISLACQGVRSSATLFEGWKTNDQ